MTLSTPLTRHAGIEVPLICGAMYPCSNPELVAAVSEAGGMTEYLAAAHAHLAWSAGREGRWDEAEREGRTALELWEQIGGPYRLFLWMPVWPLLGAALARGRLEEAAGHARVLLDPERQPMPEKLQQALEAAKTAAESGGPDARDRFARLADLARASGYL